MAFDPDAAIAAAQQTQAAPAPMISPDDLKKKGFDPDAAIAAAKQQGGGARVGYVEDIAKSLPSGVVKGITGTIGLPGTVEDWATGGMDWLANKITGQNIQTPKSPLSAEALNQAFSMYGPGFHTPQTLPGKYAETIGEFAPAALGGEAGLAARARNVLLPAVASESAGQATAGTSGEPFARLAAALLGGSPQLLRPATAAASRLADLLPANRAENALLDASRITSTPQQVVSDLRNSDSGVPGVDLSAGQATLDSGIIQLERANQMHPSASPQWAGFKSQQNSQLYGAMRDIVNPYDDAAFRAAQQARATATDPMRAAAFSLANQGGLEPSAGFGGWEDLSAAHYPADPIARQAQIAQEQAATEAARTQQNVNTPGVAGPGFTMTDPATAAANRVGQQIGQVGLESPAADRAELFGTAGVQPLRDLAAQEMAGPRGVNAGVSRLADLLNRTADQTSTAGAETIGEARRTITQALSARAGQPLSEQGSAIKSAGAASTGAVGMMDSILNHASGGMWGDYLDAFREHSADVNSIEALRNIRNDLADKVTGGAIDLSGQNPISTRAAINQIIESNSTGKYGDLIAPNIQARLDAVRTASQRIEAPNFVKMAIAGGGPGTAADLANLMARHSLSALPGGGIIGQAAGYIGNALDRAGATQLAGLLQNPDKAADAIQNAMRREGQRGVNVRQSIPPAALAAILSGQSAFGGQ